MSHSVIVGCCGWWGPMSDNEPTDADDLERIGNGNINNCALANYTQESDCQMCHGICPDRERLKGGKIASWLAQKAQESLDEHIRPEIQALAKRGNITPVEVAEIRCNSWEWEHLIPAMNDEAFVAYMENAIKNCGWHKRPYGSYNEAVEGLYAPELLRRFKLIEQSARSLGHAARDLGQEEGEQDALLKVFRDLANRCAKLEKEAAESALVASDLAQGRTRLRMALGDCAVSRDKRNTCGICGRYFADCETSRRIVGDVEEPACAGAIARTLLGKP